MIALHNSIKMSDEILLIQNDFVDIPAADAAVENDAAHQQIFGTIISNMAYYGYLPSREVTQKLMELPISGLNAFWEKAEPALKYVTGDDRNMDDFVVYQNYPQEVLDMGRGQYWVNQLLMYWGFPKELLRAEKADREPLTELASLKVLHCADETTCDAIFDKLCKTQARWTTSQKAQALHIIDKDPRFSINLDEFSFKENGIDLVAKDFDRAVRGERIVSFSTATDVLRLAATLSGSERSLRDVVRFRKFKRPERRFLVNLLEGSKNPAADFALRPEPWKQLLMRLHPGDFKASRVSEAYDFLHNKKVRTPDSHLESMIKKGDVEVLDYLQYNPGKFVRRLHETYKVFGKDAFEKFKGVTGDLTTSQLLKLHRYLDTINDRKTLIFAPGGQWSKAQLAKQEKVKIEQEHLTDLLAHLSNEIGARVDAALPEGVSLDDRLSSVKIQSNGQELAPYGRGTSFDIPDDVTFVRLASYWACPRDRNIWFDVGCNMFDEEWKAKGTICWNSEQPFATEAAIFSGDPTNSDNEEGRACQMTDLDIDLLLEEGVRYAVWNILCYSGTPFSDADEVLATLQWGQEPQTGGLYEPSRAQMAFPITGNNKTSFVAYLDLVERKLVYMDIPLPAPVNSAVKSDGMLSNTMPALVEHMESLPSMWDLFSHAKKGDIPVVLSDEDIAINGKAYVFAPKNADNTIEAISVEDILNAKGSDLEPSVSLTPETVSP